MAESDRERLVRIAQEKERERIKSAALNEQEEAKRAQQVANMDAHDRQKNDELLAYCKKTFAGLKMVPIGPEMNAEIMVDESPRADSVPSILLYFPHEDKAGKSQGRTFVAVVSYRGGTYTALKINGQNQRFESKDFNQFKDMLVELVAAHPGWFNKA